MKLSPQTQLKIAFWSITAPLLVPVAVLVILAIINPFWFRISMINWVENVARKMGEWRDNKTYVKYYYDKANLFNTLKA